LSKTGTGILALSAANTYSGGTSLNAGTLAIGSASALGTGTLAMAAGTTLTFSGGSYAIANNITVSGDPSFALPSGTTQTISGNISDGSSSGTVAMTGPGTLVLSGVNTYSGGTSLTAGTLAVGNSSALGTGTLTMAAGTTLTFSGGSYVIANNITVSGESNFAPPSGATQTISGSISDGSSPGTVVMTGPGTLVLSGANTYSGGTVVSAGTLQLSRADALGSITGALSVNGGTLDLGSTSQTQNGGVTLAGGTIQNGTLSSSGGFAVEAGAISAALAGGSSLTKTGSGTAMLSGANTYTGGTVVSAGTLQLSAGGTVGSITGALSVNGGTVDLGGTSQTQNGGVTLTSGTIQNGTLFSSGGFAVQAGTIGAALSGSGGLAKTGSGTVILDGVNTYTGGTTVSGGTLEVGDINSPGASVAGGVTVASGGTLAGHGTVEGDVGNTAGGTVSPGGTIGTLTVAGNYTQGSGSTLHIEVSPTAASKLDVSGSASLAGTLQLVYDPGVYSKASYDILHAGGVSGTFAMVSGAAPPGFGQSVSYTSTDVDLALDPSGSVAAPPTVVVAPTNDAIFGALGTTALLNAQQATTTLFGHLADLHSGSGSETIHTALAAAAPTQLAFSGNAQSLNGVLTGLPDAMGQIGGWFRGIGDFASLSGNSSMPGFDTRSGGFLAGIDRPLDAHIVAGAALGYSHTDIGESGNSGSLDTPRLLLYGSYGAGPWAFDATVGYAYDSFSATRPFASLGETASSSHDGQEATGALQATRRFVLDGISLLPAAGLQYAHLFEGGFSESGASGFDLAVSSRNADSLRPFVGASASKAFTTDHMVLIPEADLAYSHEMFNTPPSLVSVGGGSFIVDGLVPSRDQVTLGGGVSAKMSERFAVYADYHAVLPSGNLFEQTVSAGLSYRF
jgi:fibronectin-binding autotransporter adhesin